MYNIIKLLLLGTDECVNFAGLLYGLTKDKKDALKQITKKLRVTRTQLLETHIDHLLALYQ